MQRTMQLEEAKRPGRTIIDLPPPSPLNTKKKSRKKSTFFNFFCKSLKSPETFVEIWDFFFKGTKKKVLCFKIQIHHSQFCWMFCCLLAAAADGPAGVMSLKVSLCAAARYATGTYLLLAAASYAVGHRSLVTFSFFHAWLALLYFTR